MVTLLAEALDDMDDVIDPNTQREGGDGDGHHVEAVTEAGDEPVEPDDHYENGSGRQQRDT